MIVDTGTPANRKQWLEDVFSLVEPEDVKWVYLSHDDVDHTGNLDEVMTACPNATLVVQLGDARAPHERVRLPARALPLGQRRRVASTSATATLTRRAAAGLRLADHPRAVRPEDRRLLGRRLVRLPDAGRADEQRVASSDPEFWARGHGDVHVTTRSSPWLSLVDPERYADALRPDPGARHGHDRDRAQPADHRGQIDARARSPATCRTSRPRRARTRLCSTRCSGRCSLA